jgi:hypothetical protein
MKTSCNKVSLPNFANSNHEFVLKLTCQTVADGHDTGEVILKAK